MLIGNIAQFNDDYAGEHKYQNYGNSVCLLVSNICIENFIIKEYLNNGITQK